MDLTRRRFARLLIKLAARLLVSDGDTTNTDAAAFHHVYTSARLAGWPDAAAATAAKLMIGCGVAPLAAQRLFDDSDRRVQ